ncbi:hypothetical protein [Lutibacter sp.]|uniref:hypothetical protein n=1 Tax=Lutibacter sp. TaxID=1925666 RepID=UPI0025C321BE|nr:hypothetical protein [Lutibacter sp.]MCF6181968.1 hypothetical protein [Lutibacter sp.]
MKINTLTKTDKLGYVFLIIAFAFGLYYANTDLNYFETVYAVEDGFVENSQFVLLLCSSLLLFYYFFKFFKHKNASWKLGVLVMAIAFFFASGEEISWGQRIFNVQSSEFFIENNAQHETNLHNMVVDGEKINKLIFSQLLTILLVIYLLILPILYRKVASIKKLANLFAVPIVKWHHTIAFLIATGLIVFVHSKKKWELYELAFAVIFLLIFINPLNKREIFTANS